MGKLIMIMIDGINADHFEQYRQHLPNLDRLARTGTQLKGMRPEMCGTSCPGRTSIIAGVAPSEHGVYGNFIFADGGFRWANPYDVKVDTLPGLAKQQGLDVACIGYGMVRPEDCTLYHGPWWADEMLMRGKDAEPLPADMQWQHAGKTYDPEGRISALNCETPEAPNHNPDIKLQLGMLADQQLLDIAAGLACSEQAPDFILLEIAITDYFLHKYGPDHALTRWSLRTADAQIGTLLARLDAAGKGNLYNFAIVSDHGHAGMPQGLYVDRLLGDDVIWSSEGGVLLVKPHDAVHALEVSDKLLAEGMEICSTDFMPAEQQEQLIAFMVPAGSDISFETAVPGTEGICGPSKYTSNHGMRPGTWADFRFCIFSGPDVPQQQLGIADNTRFAPTMAHILGVETPWQATSLLEQPPETHDFSEYLLQSR
ncbi:alkaline phosphatase family protein [Pontibacterium granulatum]|uniref:alkaline phosphatase family protein n=1 Tax=Pontibacterium granulatum TaxID=2036029 RepID=UPI00249A87FF|nr:alkaline phosphatase family protein [Pontibacterium granulatum]MDI3326135.1 alkaline phosphatase family protein [Pontibacterium granulatum]